MIFLDIVQNIALLVALAVVCQIIETQWRSDRLLAKLLYGLLFGLAGLVIMVTPVPFMPGIVFDGRSIVLSVGGLLGGPVVALVAAALCGAYRLRLGGAGAAMGVSVVAASALLGVLFHYRWRKPNRRLRLRELWLFGLLVHLVMLGLISLLPGAARQAAWRQLSLAIVGVYPVATMLILRLFLDYEKQRHDQAALRESEARFRAIASHTPDHIFIQDHELRYRYAVNPPLGLTAAEMLGKRDDELLAREDAEKILAIKRQVLETGAPFYLETSLQNRAGAPEYFEGSYIPLCDADGKTEGLIGYFRNVTERKRAEEDHARLEGQFLQAQKMESVGRLAGGVAHDFNNMLMGMLNYIDLCRDELPAGHPVRGYLDEVARDAQRSANLTRQLLAFARKQTIRPRVLNLNDAVADMLTLLRRMIGEDIDLVWKPGADLGEVLLDPSQVDQLLANLCVNARDAIDGAGTIVIETAREHVDRTRVEAHPDVVPGEYIRLTVSDTGCGISREVMDHLFEPFFTTKDVGRGTGLGLATVYGIVKQNNGFIDVDSAPGNGARFHLHLPRIEPAGEKQASPGQAPAAAGKGETVLVVEDEKSLRVTCGMFLEALGYKVLLAEAPAEALSVAARHVGAIHLLLTDVVMPGMNGRQLAEKLRIDKPALRCLYMSGYTADAIASRGELGANAPFIQKPFSRDELARKAREVLDRSS